MKPKVSLITCYYNRENNVAKSVASLLAQTYSPLEIILVDDGSKDGTLSRLRLFERDPRVKVVSQTNMGFTRSIKNAVETHSTGDYVAIHGSGDVSLPDRIEIQATFLDLHPDTTIVSGLDLQLDIVTGLAIGGERDPGEITFDTFLKGRGINQGSAMFRRSAYEKAGGYEPLFTFSQDTDLFLRMLKLGPAYIVNHIVYHRMILTDGVSYVPKKVLEQLQYKYLARFLAETDTSKRSGILHTLEQNGVGAVISASSPKVQHDLLKRRATLLRIGRAKEAQSMGIAQESSGLSPSQNRFRIMLDVISTILSAINLPAGLQIKLATVLRELVPRKKLIRNPKNNE